MKINITIRPSIKRGGMTTTIIGRDKLIISQILKQRTYYIQMIMLAYKLYLISFMDSHQSKINQVQTLTIEISINYHIEWLKWCYLLCC